MVSRIEALICRGLPSVTVGEAGVLDPKETWFKADRVAAADAEQDQLDHAAPARDHEVGADR